MNAYDELVSRIKKVPISRLGDVVAAIDGRHGFSRREIEQAGKLATDLSCPTGVRDLAAAVLDAAVDGDRVEAIEREIVRVALQRAGGNKSEAARLCGMERKSYARRLVKYKVK